MRGLRRSIALTVLLIFGLVAGMIMNSLWRARAGDMTHSSNASLTQSSQYEYAVITNLLVTSSSGKMVATAWIRYFRGASSELVGLNQSVAMAVDYPKDEAAIRRWMGTTNSEEGVNLSGVNLTAETVKQELAEQVKREALAKAFAKLGNDGWELVGPDGRSAQLFAVNPMLTPSGGATSQPVMIYFKRHVS